MLELNSKVIVSNTQLQGTVVGRAEYAWTPPCYLVEFVDMLGTPRREWFDSYQLNLIQ
jgi:hypothetical protein